jgi:hypothetical protein
MTTEEKIEQIFQDIHDLKYRASRLESDTESEKRTRAQRNADFDKLLLKIESDFKDVLYGRDRRSGIIIEIDRLNQVKRLVWGLIVVVTPVALKVVIDWFSK